MREVVVELTTLNNDVNDIKTLIEQGLRKIIEINQNLERGSLFEIRNDIGLIYPEKVRLEKSGVRTTRKNDLFNVST